jgi:hypothetical protein
MNNDVGHWKESQSREQCFIEIFFQLCKHFWRSDVSTHLKKFLKIFPGLSLLPPGVVGVAGDVVELFDVEIVVGETWTGLDMLLGDIT